MVQLPHQHGKNPSYVLEDMPKDGDFSAVSEIFHSVSDPKRLKLFWLLCHYEECVINLSALMGMSSPALSHHLKVLKAQGLIKSRRVGKEMYYTAADGEASRLLHHMIEMLVDISCPREKKVLCQMLGCPTTKSPFRNSARHLPSSFFANSHRESGS